MNYRLFLVIVVSALGFLISCHKEPVTNPASSNYSTNQTYSLASQTWIMYQYSDTTSSNIVPANDTLHFTSMDHVTWGDSAATYCLWKDGRYGQGLNFSHTPQGTFGSNYISNAAFDTDSIQFVIRFYGYQAKYCWFRRI